MRKLLVIITVVLACLSAEVHAQTWNEWFKQKKTQNRYSVKQIAMLKIYLEFVKKGVKVVRKGLNTIENVKNGNFNLHRDFFSSLENVNPHIANSAKVADIIAYQVFIVRQLGQVNSFCRRNKNFTSEEVRYVADVYANMLVLCDANLSELLTIIRSDKTKMTDDARVQRIDIIHSDMVDKCAFVQSFDQDAKLIAHEREREQKQIEWLKVQYD